MSLRVSHLGICVSDVEASLRFYRDALGFEVKSELEVKGEPSDTLLRLRDVALRAVYLRRDGLTIELLHYASPGLYVRRASSRVCDLGARRRQLPRRRLSARDTEPPDRA